MIRLTILGCHSATPRVNAFPTSQYLEINNNHFLVDCGEGTQRQMRKYKVGFSKIFLYLIYTETIFMVWLDYYLLMEF
jgi:ribonuclease Z